MEHYDVAVIGAGFGGLACALELAHRGARVALFERLKYPGGCASTYTRRGYRFESGATLFSGFGPDQLFGRWIERFEMDVRFDAIDPLVDMRFGDLNLKVPRDRESLVEAFCDQPDAPEAAIRLFFARQRRVADALWELFDDPDLLPPFSASALLSHLGRSPRYLRLLPIIGRSLADVLRAWDVADYTPLRHYLNAVCQITVQADIDHVEAPFALGAMDYYFRGTGHIHGGIGELAWAMVHAIEGQGGQVWMTDAVAGLAPVDGGWQVESRRRQIKADTVVANLLPQAVAKLLDDPAGAPRLAELTERVEQGWGAAMLYLGLDPGVDLRPEAHHLELVGDPARPFTEGNHVFCSISGRHEPDRSPDGGRTVTCSTHVDMQTLRSSSPDDQAAYIDAIHARMREVIALRAPKLHQHINFEMTASPRTFERFTGRPHGYVGGIPRTVGWHNYRGLFRPKILDGLHLVGDTVFPGQSTLACALGGIKTAEVVMSKLRD